MRGRFPRYVRYYSTGAHYYLGDCTRRMLGMTEAQMTKMTKLLHVVASKYPDVCTSIHTVLLQYRGLNSNYGRPPFVANKASLPPATEITLQL